VAHGGEEFALGAVGLFGGVFGVNEFGFGGASAICLKACWQ
jgi:hypothetical protein